MKKRNSSYGLNDPLKHADHHRPRTRRELISQGFATGAAVLSGAALPMQGAYGDLNGDFNQFTDVNNDNCELGFTPTGRIPFICFDLAGGANVAGSNVLVGGRGGQNDFLDTAGYSKQGLPGDMVPGVANVNGVDTENEFINRELGLAFHSDSGFLLGILEKLALGNRANVNGCVIAARSENDTGNNPHNPMYAIAKAGADGALVTLCGSRSSDSGGNSLAPMAMIDPEIRPTKIDRNTDVTGLVDIGDLRTLLSTDQVSSVLKSMFLSARHKLDRVDTGLGARDAEIKRLMRCNYAKSADLVANFGDPDKLDIYKDTHIIGDDTLPPIFTEDDLDGDREFQKTAAVMKMVLDGPYDAPGLAAGSYAGAGTITMGGYDYHTGDRRTGEGRDLRAGRCMGACLEYAARKNKPLMMYVFSDGSVFSNGMTDDSVGGRGKGVWTGDNQQTASSFFLVYNPNGAPQLAQPRMDDWMGKQIGFMRPSGDVETSSSPAANNVNLLVETVLLNYLALHFHDGSELQGSQFMDAFMNAWGGNSIDRYSQLEDLIAFQKIL